MSGRVLQHVRDLGGLRGPIIQQQLHGLAKAVVRHDAMTAEEACSVVQVYGRTRTKNDAVFSHCCRVIRQGAAELAPLPLSRCLRELTGAGWDDSFFYAIISSEMIDRRSSLYYEKLDVTEAFVEYVAFNATRGKNGKYPNEVVVARLSSQRVIDKFLNTMHSAQVGRLCASYLHIAASVDGLAPVAAESLHRLVLHCLRSDVLLTLTTRELSNVVRFLSLYSERDSSETPAVWLSLTRSKLCPSFFLQARRPFWEAGLAVTPPSALSDFALGAAVLYSGASSEHTAIETVQWCRRMLHQHYQCEGRVIPPSVTRDLDSAAALLELE
ncbi:hypothetical protein DIPPA_12048 [Diplonema papillatum]|nr:hypothetical protein DIPPA_12048 [Diplonema papillatum]